MAKLVRTMLPCPKTLPWTLKVCIRSIHIDFMNDLKLTLIKVAVEGKKVIQTVTIAGEVVSKQTDSKSPVQILS